MLKKDLSDFNWDPNSEYDFTEAQLVMNEWTNERLFLRVHNLDRDLRVWILRALKSASHVMQLSSSTSILMFESPPKIMKVIVMDVGGLTWSLWIHNFEGRVRKLIKVLVLAHKLAKPKINMFVSINYQPVYKSTPVSLMGFSLPGNMKPLASLFWVVFVLRKASCGYDEANLEVLRDLWLRATKRTNESLFRQSKYGDDFEHLIDTLSRLNTSSSRQNLIQDLKMVILQNSYERIFGFKIGMFTNFCGPGDVAGPDNATVCGSFHGVDECCKAHDSCDHYIVSKSDYENYPNLPRKDLYFTSLSCECDVEFYNCMKRTNSVFGEIILAIYSVAQISCFQHEHQVVKCTKYDEYDQRCFYIHSYALKFDFVFSSFY